MRQPDAFDDRKPIPKKMGLGGLGHAFAGLMYLYRTQSNFRLHIVSAAIAVGLGIALRISAGEFLAVILAILLVLIAEALNTCIEWITDVLFPHFDQRAKKIKDVSAAAVLLTCLAALGVGLYIFGPRIWHFIQAPA